MTERRFDCDVAVIGAGPAGLSAACAAASHGARVVVVDPQPHPGGQVWRNDVAAGMPAPSRRLQAVLRDAPRVSLLMQSEVVAHSGRRLFLRTGEQGASIDYGALVLATGARELLLPFPGWTLPGVTGAGGAQALAKQGWPLRGKRVLVAGSGPLLLATAQTLQRHGANVLGIHEQAGLHDVAAFASALWRWPAKVRQALQLRGALWRVPYRCGSHVVRALGDERLRAVEIRVGDRVETIECEQLACGFGLVPNVELAQVLGCGLEADGAHPRVVVDRWQHSSVEGIYAAGEACGVGGVDCAAIEGEIAGHAAAGQREVARPLLPARAHARRFAALLHRRFALEDAVRALADGDTIVCRCEDVTLAELADSRDAREAKLATRCGMGACQGRICGTVLAELRGFARGGFRPPLFPVPLGVMASFDADAPAVSSPGATQ